MVKSLLSPALLFFLRRAKERGPCVKRGGTYLGMTGFPAGQRPRGACQTWEPIMKSIPKKAAFLASFVAMALLATACNTVEGAGKDTKNLGQNIQNEANEHK